MLKYIYILDIDFSCHTCDCACPQRVHMIVCATSARVHREVKTLKTLRPGPRASSSLCVLPQLMVTVALLAWAAAAAAPASGDTRAHNTADLEVALLQLQHGTISRAAPLPGTSAPSPVLYPLGCTPLTCRANGGCALRNDDNNLVLAVCPRHVTGELFAAPHGELMPHPGQPQDRQNCCPLQLAFDSPLCDLLGLCIVATFVLLLCSAVRERGAWRKSGLSCSFMLLLLLQGAAWLLPAAEAARIDNAATTIPFDNAPGRNAFTSDAAPREVLRLGPASGQLTEEAHRGDVKGEPGGALGVRSSDDWTDAVSVGADTTQPVLMMHDKGGDALAAVRTLRQAASSHVRRPANARDYGYDAFQSTATATTASLPPSMPHNSFPSHADKTPLPTKFELAGNDAALVDPSVRRLTHVATTTVSPGAGTLQAALDAASAGDILELADGTYTGSGSYVLQISKDITIRAQNFGRAILDGENARRVIEITGGTVVLEGLGVTKGSAVRRRQQRCHPAPLACLLLLTWYVWLPCVLAGSKSTASYTMKPPHRPDGVLAFADILCMAPLCARRVTMEYKLAS